MKEFQAKRRVRRALYSGVSLVLLFVLVLFLAKATWNVYWKAQESKNNSVLSEKELAVLQKRHDFLKAEISSLKTPEGKEKEIRQNFQVSKEGEHIVVIVEATSTVNTQVEEQGAMKGVWNSFLHLFGR